MKELLFANPLPQAQCHLAYILPFEAIKRIVTRYDRNATNFLASVCLAATVSYWL